MEKTSSFVAKRTNLLHSNSVTHADEEMSSNGSRAVSSLTINPFPTGLPEERRVR